MPDFYEKNHQQYFKATVDIDPQHFLAPLTKQLKPQSSILDVGCGSGRDLLWLKSHGFEPTGFEQSPGLAHLARTYSGCQVIEGDFTSFDFASSHYDGLILVGAMVHLASKAFPAIFTAVCQALTTGGVILITMKEGYGIAVGADGRSFTLWQQDELEAVFHKNNLEIISFTKQISKLNGEDTWLSYILLVL